jgi:chemotaxis protein methyltransferase CheR
MRDAVEEAASSDDAGDEVEEIETRLFLDAIYARYGYDLRDYTTRSITRRVRAALARSGLRHMGELQHRVLTDPGAFAQVLEDLTVRVSEIFRDPDFYRTFRERVTPILRTYPQLNVWHAGCATGEEAYSSAILLHEEGLYDRCQVYATDLSAQAIEQSKQGLYPAKNLPAVVESYRRAGGTSTFDRYATSAYDHIALNESLRRKILFFQHSLVSDHVFGEMHVIFCRNVLIYFGHDLRERVMEKFSQSLCPGGFLCLGTSERLPPEHRGRFTEFAANERIYRYVG